MPQFFKLPDLGEGIHEGEVIAVLVTVGDEVTEGDPLLEVETDKAAVEIPSPFTGEVLEIKVKPGDAVKVGDVLVVFSGGENGASEVSSPGARDMARAEDSTAATSSGGPAAESSATASKHLRTEGPVPASPATRRLARELGIDLHDVPPTGPEGLVTAEDVRTFARKPKGDQQPEISPVAGEPGAAGTVPVSAPPLPDFNRWGAVENVPLRSIRKATARQMTLSWSQIPHASSQDEIDVTRLEILRRRLKDTVTDMGGRLTITVFAVKAAAAALKKFPQFNASLDMGQGMIVRKKYYHIGVAADTGEGLMVPVVRDADRKSITDIAVELHDLVKRARLRKVALEELQGGTFTITNIGAAGGRGHITPIIHYPEAAILGMSAARMKPIVFRNKGGSLEIAPRLVMPVVLSIDHRLLDGVDATKFLEFFRNTLENPEKMLLTV